MIYTNNVPIILASGSPRRQQYLTDLGLQFTVQVLPVKEQSLPGEKPDVFVMRMAKEKAAAVSRLHPASWVISGDTVVCHKGRILGKPVDRDDAVRLLMTLSGQEHDVLSGFCVVHDKSGVCICRVVSSKVRFAQFPENVAIAYVATDEPMDKAGAYGIQGLGAGLVAEVNGSYSNIVGLPLCELIETLLEQHVIIPR